MNISAHGLQFVAGWEGLRNRLYDDGGPGVGNCTIGVGHLVHLGPCDGRAAEQPFLGGLSNEQCYALLRADAQRFVTFVNRQATVPLTQPQFDALVDFSFNTGGGYPAVWAAVNGGGDVCAVLRRTAILPAWATAALVRRREAECRLYHETYGPDAPEEDEMQRINGVATYFENKAFAPGDAAMNVYHDFPHLPAEAKAVRLEVFLTVGGEFTLRDGDGNHAGRVAGLKGYGQIDAFLAPLPEFGGARGLRFSVAGNVTTQRVGILGWFP